MRRDALREYDVVLYFVRLFKDALLLARYAVFATSFSSNLIHDVKKAEYFRCRPL